MLLAAAGALFAGNEAFNGRWTIEPAGDNNGRVLWLEVNGAGTAKITGWMVGGGPGGQLDAIHNARIERGHLRFHLERRSNRTGETIKTPVSAALHGDNLLALRNAETARCSGSAAARRSSPTRTTAHGGKASR